MGRCGEKWGDMGRCEALRLQARLVCDSRAAALAAAAALGGGRRGSFRVRGVVQLGGGESSGAAPLGEAVAAGDAQAGAQGDGAGGRRTRGRRRGGRGAEEGAFEEAAAPGVDGALLTALCEMGFERAAAATALRQVAAGRRGEEPLSAALDLLASGGVL